MTGEKVSVVLDFSVFLCRRDRRGATNRGNHVEFVFSCQIALLYQLKARKFDTYHFHIFGTLIGLVGAIPSCE